MRVWTAEGAEDEGSAPGDYAERRYQRGLAEYRSRARWILAACFGPFMLLGVAGLFVVGHPPAWAAGVLFGVGAGVIIALRASPPEYVDKWRRGAEGERKTARALRRLGPGRWTVVHDVDAGYGNYDHILVGPIGVFLLDSKHLQGTVHLANGRPHLRRRLDPDDDRSLADCAGAAERLARQLHDVLKRQTGEAVWVHAVVVLWSDSNQDLYKLGKCTFVCGNRLRQWLLQQDAKFDETRVAHLSAAVEALASSTRTMVRNPQRAPDLPSPT